jgi:uncharacterized protein YkwD
MKKHKIILRPSAVLAFVVAAIMISALARAQSLPTTERTTVYLQSEEVKFLNILNQFRRSIGAPELRVHTQLQIAAEKHSKWMAAQDMTLRKESLDHNGPSPTTTFSDRIEAEGYTYTSIGENVACGNNSAEETFKQFAFSPPHLKNMMNPHFQHIGLSRAGTGAEICPFYWTTDFGSRLSPNHVAGIETNLAKIAQAINQALGLEGNGAATHPSGLSTLQQLSQPSSPQHESEAAIRCLVPAPLGFGVLTGTQNLITTLDLTPSENGYLMRVSYRQDGSSARFTSYSVSGATVVKSPFYPLLTLFAAPNNRFGGFMIQIDLASGRAQFDPYPGQGGQTGMIECKVSSF